MKIEPNWELIASERMTYTKYDPKTGKTPNKEYIVELWKQPAMFGDEFVVVVRYGGIRRNKTLMCKERHRGISLDAATNDTTELTRLQMIQGYEMDDGWDPDETIQYKRKIGLVNN